MEFAPVTGQNASMNLVRDLQYVSDGATPASIRALVEMGYATFPPAQLTEAGASLPHKLTEEDRVQTPEEPI